MTALSIDPLKYLGKLPNFDGGIDDLQSFCDVINRIHPFLSNFDVSAQPVFIDLIKSKLRGQAKLVMDINCQAVSWPEIKNILVNNFSDKRTCDELYDEMRNVSFKTNFVVFYNELREKLRRLNNKTLSVTGMGDALNECTRNNRRSALNFFTSRLPEPMKSILVCRDPENIEEAMDILFKAGYAYYGKEYIKSNLRYDDNGLKPKNKYNKNENSHEESGSQNNSSNYKNNYKQNGNNNNQNNNGNRKYYHSNNYDNNRNNYHNNNHNNYHNNYHNNNGNNHNNAYSRNNFNQANNSSNSQGGPNRQANPFRNSVQQPEPMEVEHHEAQPIVQGANFPLTASKEIYHI